MSHLCSLPHVCTRDYNDKTRSAQQVALRLPNVPYAVSAPMYSAEDISNSASSPIYRLIFVCFL